jgi:hypothetical protein
MMLGGGLAWDVPAMAAYGDAVCDAAVGARHAVPLRWGVWNLGTGGAFDDLREKG